MSEKIILLIEDDKDIQQFNKHLLERQGFCVETAATLAEARTRLRERRPDAVILDRGMPDGSGLDFLREIRESDGKLPVLMLTGYTADYDVFMGFQGGCDDYIPKPYVFEILLAKLRRLLEKAEQVPDTITRGTLILRLTPRREAFVNGKGLSLTPKEYELLQFMVENEDRCMNPIYIYEKVWGQPMRDDSRALKVAVSRLRTKLEGSGYTITYDKHGNGYLFERNRGSLLYSE